MGKQNNLKMTDLIETNEARTVCVCILNARVNNIIFEDCHGSLLFLDPIELNDERIDQILTTHTWKNKMVFRLLETRKFLNEKFFQCENK